MTKTPHYIAPHEHLCRDHVIAALLAHGHLHVDSDAGTVTVGVHAETGDVVLHIIAPDGDAIIQLHASAARRVAMVLLEAADHARPA